MDNSSSQTIKFRTITPNTAALKMLLEFLATLMLTAVLLFGGAGRLDWKLGWLFAGVWILPKLGFLILLRWRNPELLIERATRHPNVQPYDRIILPVYFVLAFGTFLVGSLDVGRFQWSGALPGWVIIAAYAIYLAGNGLAGWAIPIYTSPDLSGCPSALAGKRSYAWLMVGDYPWPDDSANDGHSHRSRRPHVKSRTTRLCGLR